MVKKKKTYQRLATRELARRSMIHYARIITPTLALTPFHKTYYRILDAFARGHLRRLIISVPPQHGKSLGSSILLPGYVLGLRPECKIAIASYNLSLAARFNRRVQQQMDDPIYRNLFPRSRLKSKGGARQENLVRTSAEFDLIGQRGGVLAVGREGSLTGNPVDLFILDDLYKDAMEANSPLIRDNAWEWYNAVVKTRLHNTAQELIVFTRWHEDDLIGRIEAHETVEEIRSWAQLEPHLEGAPFEGWLKLNFEAIQESEPTEIDPRVYGEALWPERHNRALLDRKRRLDRTLFEAMYQGHPMAREGLLYGEQLLTYELLPEDLVKVANYTDTADTGEDFLCSICYSVGREGLIYITDVVYAQDPMEVTEPLVAQMLLSNATRLARIESNNGGRGFARAVQRLAPGVRVEWFHQGKNKESRILSNASSVMRCLRFPQGWADRWPRLYHDLTTYRRIFRANRFHDAVDVVTGIIETETDRATPKKIAAVSFSGAGSSRIR